MELALGCGNADVTGDPGKDSCLQYSGTQGFLRRVNEQRQRGAGQQRQPFREWCSHGEQSGGGAGGLRVGRVSRREWMLAGNRWRGMKN